MHLTTFLPVLLLSFSATTLAQKCNPNHNLKCCKVRNSLADGAVTDVTDGAGVALDPELLGTVGAECTLSPCKTTLQNRKLTNEQVTRFQQRRTVMLRGGMHWRVVRGARYVLFILYSS